MRRIRFAAAAAVAALGVMTTATAGADAPKAKTVTCKVVLHNVAPPAASKGEDFGTVTCPSVFGDGVVHDTITITPQTRTSGAVNGTYREFFNQGTVHGTFKLTFAVGSTGIVTTTGRAKIAGGSGAFKRAKGSVDVKCKGLPDKPNVCTEKRTLTF